MPKYHLLTFGCQMNKNDSERIAGLLASLGFESVNSPEKADLLVINTCSVRQSAEDRVFGTVQNWQEFRQQKPNLIIAVTGCMAGRDKDGKLKAKLPGADLFFPIESLPMLPVWLRELNPELIFSDKSVAADYFSCQPVRASRFSGFVSIQTGCNNFCTYCVVPYARGREKNRPVKEILREVKDFAESGGKEITLLGQVVNNYQAPDSVNFSRENPFKNHFAALLWECNQIEGIERIHFTAPDPQYFSGEQIEALKLPQQVNYLHLPVQSGDNDVLRRMNRHYTREDYLDLVRKIRAARPDIALGTDIIVGFCGETEAQFENTVDLYRQCDFDISYHAMYSERIGTAAARAFKDDVSRAEKKRRWDALQKLMEENTFRKNQKYAGQTVRVLVDKCEPATPVILTRQSAGKELLCSGNTDEMKLAQFAGTPELAGQTVKIKITQAQTWVLRGEYFR